jgi:thiol-disulfide isomerase/thioredoxin
VTAETLDVPSLSSRLSTRRAVVAIAVLIAVTAAVAVFIGRDAATDDPSSPTGRVAAPFTLPELRADRGQVGLAAAPGKPTVVNFFANWCAPCKRELPAMRDAAAAHPEVAFLGVDHQDSREDAIELLDRFGVTYPAGYDPKGDVGAKYFIRGLPATAFIDADGRIVDFHQGELTTKELQERLDKLTLRKSAA